MKAVLKKPRKNAEVVDIENTLQGIRKAVGGYFQAVTFSAEEKIIMLCDEEGKNKGLDYNFTLGEGQFKDIAVGNVLFVSSKKDEFRELDEEQIKYLMKYFNASLKEYKY